MACTGQAERVIESGHGLGIGPPGFYWMGMEAGEVFLRARMGWLLSGSQNGQERRLGSATAHAGARH